MNLLLLLFFWTVFHFDLPPFRARPKHERIRYFPIFIISITNHQLIRRRSSFPSFYFRGNPTKQHERKWEHARRGRERPATARSSKNEKQMRKRKRNADAFIDTGKTRNDLQLQGEIKISRDTQDLLKDSDKNGGLFYSYLFSSTHSSSLDVSVSNRRVSYFVTDNRIYTVDRTRPVFANELAPSLE